MYTVYGISYCPSCEKAKKLLSKKGSAYKFINLDSNPEKFSEIESPEIRTVPQVFSPSGERIGGYEDLEMSFK